MPCVRASSLTGKNPLTRTCFEDALMRFFSDAYGNTHGKLDYRGKPRAGRNQLELRILDVELHLSLEIY